jgi:hypothetical protein
VYLNFKKGPTIHENAKFVKFLGIFRNDGKIHPDIVYVYIFLNRAQILPWIAITAKSDGGHRRRMKFCRMVVIHVNALHLRFRSIHKFFLLHLISRNRQIQGVYFLFAFTCSKYIPCKFTPSVKFTYIICTLVKFTYVCESSII